MVLAEAKTLPEAMDYALEICEKKDLCELLFSNGEQAPSPRRKTMTAPALSDEDYALLEKNGSVIIVCSLH